MVQTNKPSGTPPLQDKTLQDQEVCPQCGQALYDCTCPDRWENEGGATRPPDDAMAS